MARKPKKQKPKSKQAPINLTGKSIQELIDMPYHETQSLNADNLRKIVTKLASAANKRIRRIEQDWWKHADTPEISVPAYKYAMDAEKGEGLFSVKGKSYNELRHELARVSHFLNMKTSSVRGWKEYKRSVIKGFEEGARKAGQDLKIEEKDFIKIFQVYAKLKELNPYVSTYDSKSEEFKEIADIVAEDPRSPEEIAVDIHTRGGVTEWYERSKQLQEEFESGGVSSFIPRD